MFYRENGQFKTTYAADQQIFPVTQDRVAMLAVLLLTFVVVPLLASDYTFQAILIPFLIMSLGALGLNILVGYCGQISLGTGAFMAVGAYAAYNLQVRFDGMPLLVSLIGGGLMAMVVGVVFGLPSLRIRGLYLAVATLAAQFFMDWLTSRAAWVTNNSSSGSVSAGPLSIAGWQIDTPMEKYLLCLGILCVLGLGAKNLVRSAVGREWMAMRDMDVAAAVIGIRPMYAKLLFMIIIGGLGSIVGSFFGAAFFVLLPIFLTQVPHWLGLPLSTATAAYLEHMIFGALIVFFLIVEPHGLAKLWSTARQKLRLWPFPH